MTYDTINDAQTMQPNAEGALLANRYRVVRQLGAGGMGSVWLAEDTQLDNKLFAIKMLPSILVSNKRAYRQLKDEALVAMQLVHPNIVQIRAFEENDGNPFLVMDYVDGETLDDYLAEKGKLGEDEVIRVLRPIAAALDYAHSKGVVHRDVKPGNGMIAKDGTPYILDFGIAREIQETMTRVTGKLSSGTLLYMSPEQLNGDAPKPAQDVYSFAAMAYECLKGEPPFVRGAIEDQIKNKLPEPLRSDGALAVGIMAGLAKKPEDRPSTCAAALGWEDAQSHATLDNGPASSSTPVDEIIIRVPSPPAKSWGLGKAIAILAFLAALVGIWRGLTKGGMAGGVGGLTENTDNSTATKIANVTNIISSAPTFDDVMRVAWKEIVCGLITNNSIEVSEVKIGGVYLCTSNEVEKEILSAIKDNFKPGCNDAIEQLKIAKGDDERNPVLSGQLNDGYAIQVTYADGINNEKHKTKSIKKDVESFCKVRKGAGYDSGK